MAPKRSIFIDNPPSASSTEKDDYSSEDVELSQPTSENSNNKPSSNSKPKPLASTHRSGTKRSLDNNANGSDAKLSKKKKKKKATVSAFGGSLDNNNNAKGEIPKEDEHIGSCSKNGKIYVDNTMILNEIFRNDLCLCTLDKDVVKRGLESTEESKQAEMQEKWKQLYIAELELFVNRASLIKDQANSAAQALKKSIN